MINFTVAIFSFNHHQDLLPYAIKSVRKHLPLNEIVVVWDDFVREREINFDEIRDQVNYNFRVINHSEIYNWPEAIGQWGWIKQQLAKLLCYTYIDNEYTWIYDGDVYLTGDPELFNNNMPYLRYHQGQTVPDEYKPFITDYFGIDNFYSDTFVGSTCLFDHYVLRELFNFCQTRNQKDLITCVNDMILSKNHSPLPFSEFETYGHFLLHKFPERMHLRDRNWCYENHFKDPKRSISTPIHIMWADSTETIISSEDKLLKGDYNVK